MATNTQLKFYKLGANASMPTTGLTTGAIYFVPKEGVIRVATSATSSEAYGGKLNDANWDSTKLKLTITKYDGSSLELDFSDMASSSAVTAALNDINTKIDTIEASVGLDENGGFVKNATNYGGSASTIGGEIKNLDATLKSLSDNVSKMATSDVVDGLNTRMAAAEGDIDALQAATAGYDGTNTVAKAIAAAKAEAKSVVAASTDTFSAAHLEVTPTTSDVDNHVTYTVKVKDLATSSEHSALYERVIALDSDTGRVKNLENKVDALSSATHFEGVVSWDPAEVSIGSKDANGDFTINGEKYQSGDIVIYKPATGQSKEYILDGTATTPVFIELGDTTATDAAIAEVDDRVDVLEIWKTDMTKSNGTLATMNSTIDSKLDASTYNTFIGTTGDYGIFKSNTSLTLTNIENQFDAVDAIIGFDSDVVSEASYNGTTYLNTVKTLMGADKTLDAELAALELRVADVEGGVAKVVGDNTTISVETVDGMATVSAVTSELSANVTGLAKAADVFSALCWVEFN